MINLPAAMLPAAVLPLPRREVQDTPRANGPQVDVLGVQLAHPVRHPLAIAGRFVATCRCHFGTPLD